MINRNPPSPAARAWLAALAAVGLALASTALSVAGTAAAATGPRAQKAPPPVSCRKVPGPFHESGTRIIAGNGATYVPYGVTVTGMAGPTDGHRYDAASAVSQVNGAASWWCVNTVRLQVAQSYVAGSNKPSGFLSALKHVVKVAEGHGLVVALSDQTEEVGLQPEPTSQTATFWKDLTRLYGHDPQVVFDLFNEPRIGTGSSAAVWRIWRNGGTYKGNHYIGMQKLVTDVRHDGARNLLWVEGVDHAGTLDRVSDYLITGGAPLQYDYHHPPGAHSVSAWARDFGYLVTKHIASVVDGEWTNYASPRGECWTDAITAIPSYLSYLHSLGVGMTVWTLQKGVMLSTGNFWQPTKLGPGWACKNNLDEGAGTLVMSWYKRHNKLG
jgi:Cellulase (glycosyl hydrolase family 5)